MPDPCARIDDQLAETRADQWRAETTLTAIQRQREELDAQELDAVAVVAACHKRYDYLLDERLRTRVMVDAAEALVT